MQFPRQYDFRLSIFTREVENFEKLDFILPVLKKENINQIVCMTDN